METIHVRAVVQPDGSLHIDDLLFPPGEEVEVTVQPQDRSYQSSVRSPLEGTVLKYLDPTLPVTEFERAPIFEVSPTQMTLEFNPVSSIR